MSNGKKEFNPKSQITGIAVLLVLIVITFLIIRSNVSDLNFSGIVSAIKDFNLVYFLPSFVFLIFYIFFEGRAMAAVAKPFKVDLNYKKSFVYACTELYFSGLTPSATGGQPALLYYMTKDRYKGSKCTAMTIMNTMYYSLSLILLGIFAIIVRPELFLAPGKTYNDGALLFQTMLIVGTSLMVLLFFGCLMCMFARKLVKRLCSAVLRLLGKLRIIKSYEQKLQELDSVLDEYGRCVKTIRTHPYAQIKCLVFNLFQRLTVFTIPFFIYAGFAGGSTPGTYLDILCIQILSTLSVSTLPLPGGVGASEMIFFSLYAKYYSAGMVQYGMLFSRFFTFYLLMIICAVVTMANHARLTMFKQNGGK